LWGAFTLPARKAVAKSLKEVSEYDRGSEELLRSRKYRSPFRG
jgi:hypothetical protein